MQQRKSDQLAARTNTLTHDEHRHADTAMLIVDMIADFDFTNGDRIFENALPAARKIADLKTRANEASIPVIFLNDNYGKWKNDFSATLRSAESSEKGKEIASILIPDDRDYHILKPQRSGFFATPLDVLLGTLDISRLIVTGLTTDICILFTAHDAYMRGYSVAVPSDCSAAVDRKDHENALRLLLRIADTDIRGSGSIDLSKTSSNERK